jgi:uncharacterized protein YjbJ (UPF0337 family)
MNWDQIQGKWKQTKGSVKQQWGKLTDDDLEYIAGKRDNFIGRLQERYGIAKEEAQKRVDDWAKQQREQEAQMGKPAGSEGNLADREARHATKR